MCEARSNRESKDEANECKSPTANHSTLKNVEALRLGKPLTNFKKRGWLFTGLTLPLKEVCKAMTSNEKNGFTKTL